MTTLQALGLLLAGWAISARSTDSPTSTRTNPAPKTNIGIGRRNRVLEEQVMLFGTLVQLWAHADAYLWNRARVIVGIQAGIIAGSYAVRDSPLIAALILTVGAVICRVLHLMVKRDEQTRNSYYAFIDPLAAELFAEPMYDRRQAFRMIPDPEGAASQRAGTLLDWTFFTLVVIDFVIAAIFLALACRGWQ